MIRCSLYYIAIASLMEDLQRLLFHDKYEKKAGWHKLFEDPIWTPKYDAPLPAHRQLAYDQLAKVAHSGLVSVRNFFHDPTNIFTAHEMIGNVASSTATKFTVHYNLFGGSIVALHTERHAYIFDLIDSLAVTGCFCLTELGYGNNAVMMETTATYDPATKQFEIDCPTVLSQKYWITNGAVHANYALVFAQTYVAGKHEGVNAFLVPIRDKQLNPLPGVEINDMGIKMGLNGIDNAALKFHKVRVPRENMLNRYADVDADGKFSSQVKGIQQRFFKVTERLLSGRLCIASMTLGAFKIATYITIKYSKQRKGVSPNGKSETPIFDYQLQKNALIPLIARGLGLNMLHNFAKTVFANPKGYEEDLLSICCIDKTLIGWHTERSITNMRERSGGQGFLAANYYGELLASCHAAMTAEGDNRVLMVKVMKDLLSIYSKRPDYFYDGKPVKLTDAKQLHCFQTLTTVFRVLEKAKLDRLIGRMGELKGQGKSNYDIIMFETSDEIQEFALAYGERLAVENCVRGLEKLTASKAIVANYFLIFAWEIVLRELSLFLLKDWICPKLAGQLKGLYNDLIKTAAKDVDVIVDSLNIPEHAVRVPIAKDYVGYNAFANKGEVAKL